MLYAGMMRFVAIAIAMLTEFSCVEGTMPSSAAISSSGKAVRMKNKSTAPGRFMRHADSSAKTSLAAMQRSKKTKLILGEILPGFCPNWRFGSSYLGLRKDDAWFDQCGDEESCAEHCDEDPACEQSVYYAVNRTCYLGVNMMTEQPVEVDDIFCYAKNHFGTPSEDLQGGTTPVHTVVNGMCQGFFAGFEMEGDFPRARQCQDSDTNRYLAQEDWEQDQQCHHWGPEFELTEEGCWGRCKLEPHCLTAEYDVYKADCKLGLLPMRTHNTFKNRCNGINDYHHKCQTRCYSKYGEGDETGAPMHNGAPVTREEMWSLMRHVYPTGFTAGSVTLR